MANPQIIVQPGKARALLPITSLAGKNQRWFNEHFPSAVLAPAVPGFNGTKAFLVPHNIHTHWILKQLGARIPAPIINTYDWNRSSPFFSQKVTAAFLTLNERAYVLSQMGVGKTRAALYAIDWLIKQGEVERVLIAAPLSTLSVVWWTEAGWHFPDLRCTVIHGDRRKRLKKLADDRWNVAIINHDGLKVMLDVLEKGRAGTDLFLIDELAVFRTQRTALWRAGRRVADHHRFVWGMTGSPTPNAPSDAWAQARLIDPPSCPMTFSRFREEVEHKISLYKWEPRPDAPQKVYQLLQPAVRYTRQEVQELPPIMEIDREVVMSPLQRKLYKLMKEKLLLLHSQGSVTAANAGILLYKLAQIAGGVVYDDDGNSLVIGAPDRLRVTLELIEEATGKVIIFAGFRHTLTIIGNFLDAENAARVKLGGTPISYEVVHGGVGQAARNRIFTDFQHGPEPRLLLAHPKCMSHGLTLTAADMEIWYTPYPGRETYEQACARITRIGQKFTAVIARLIGSPVERQMYNILKKRGNFQAACLELFQNNLDDV